MLNFEHFGKCTPEMFPAAPLPLQISKYATVMIADSLYSHNVTVRRAADLTPTRSCSV